MMALILLLVALFGIAALAGYFMSLPGNDSFDDD